MHIPALPSAIGSDWKVDLKGKWTGPDGKPSPTFGGQLFSFTTVDLSSEFVFSRLCRNRLSIVAHLEALRVFVAAKQRALRVVCCDNEFVTAAISAWATLNFVQLPPSVPHEHNTVRKIERVHRTLQEMVVKFIPLEPHLSPRYWGMCYLHCVDLLNIGPSTAEASPYSLWHEKPFDFTRFPVLSFGSVTLVSCLA